MHRAYFSHPWYVHRSYFFHGTWIGSTLFITWSILFGSFYTLSVYMQSMRGLPWLTWWTFSLSKICATFYAIYQIFTNKYHTWNPKFNSSFRSSYNFTPINKCGNRKNVQPIKNCRNEIIYSDVRLNSILRIRQDSNSFDKSKGKAVGKFRKTKDHLK